MEKMTATTKIGSIWIKLIIGTCFIYLTPELLSSESGLPTDAQWLASKRADAIEKIDRKFVDELEKLKIKHTKKGDLESANAIARLIEETENNLNANAWIRRLVDEKPIKHSVGHGELQINEYPKSINLTGQECKEFIFAHANSSIVYDIPIKATHFTAVGVMPSGRYINGSWKYIIKIDGDTVYESRALNTYPNNELKIEVKIPALSRRIELVTDMMGHGGADHSVWAMPRFEGR